MVVVLRKKEEELVAEVAEEWQALENVGIVKNL